MSGHPFELTASQLQEMLDPDERLVTPPGADAPPEVIAGGTFLVEDERGQLPPPPEMPTAEEIAEELGIELEELEEIAEELGIEPEEVSVVTTLAIGEEGGVEPDELPPDFPEPTGILAEQGGFISDPLPLVTTQAVGEEGGDFTEVLAEQGEDPGFATTLAIGEEGGIVTQAEGEDGDTVFTLAEGENGEIIELGEPISEMTPPGNVDDFEIAEVADVQTLAGTPDDGSLEVVTAAFGEPGGFEADVYGELYPALIDAVNSGVVPSLLDHYQAFGQFEPERIGIFVGNFTPDIVIAFGNNTVISGVSIVGYDPIAGDFIFGGNGSGEFDVLIGESSMTSTELFILGESQSPSFYVGSGDVDYALIQNFDVGSDRIQLSGFLEDYNFAIVNNSTNISTAAGDLVAVVENVTNIQDATLIFEG